MQKVSQKYIFAHKLTTKRNVEMPSLFFSSTVKEWSAQDCGISKAAKDTSMLPSKFDQKKVPPETGSEAEFGLGRVLMSFLPWNVFSEGAFGRSRCFPIQRDRSCTCMPESPFKDLS